MVNIFPDVNSVIEGAAKLVVARSQESIQQSGRFSLVLSGGSSPKKLHELLTTPAYRNQVQWDKVFFFFGDERYVPADHPDSNYLMAKKTLFEPLNINESQVFRMNTSLAPEAAALAYENDINGYFADKPSRFDLVILGIGDDAHTASLFPGTSVLQEKTAPVKSLFIEKVKMFRITLTAPLINKAAHVAFLVYGASKAPAVHHIIEGERDINQYPAQLVSPAKGDLSWFLDEAAAANLK